MLDQTSVLIAVAIATFVLPASFLAVLTAAGVRRSRGQPVGTVLLRWVTVLGASSLGVMLLMAGDLILALPIIGAIVALIALLLRRQRLRLAAWFVAGAAAPWTTVAAINVALLSLGAASSDPVVTWLAFMVGAVVMLLALMIAGARRLPDVVPAGALPGSAGRSFGDVGAAVRAPAIVGPFGLSEVALLVALVATWFSLGLVLPSSLPEPVRLAILVGVSAVLGAEAFIRAMPAPAREAFEAFSWYGEWELAQVRTLTHDGVPTHDMAAWRWLRVHPERPENRWIRVEVLTMVKRFDEAKAVASRMPTDTALERFSRAVALDFVDWFGGGDGDLAAMEAAAAEIQPADGDDHLRAEVVMAVARVRRRMATGDSLQAATPLREVRRRLGRRADGQVGRALRGRLIRALVAVGAVLALLSLLLPGLSPR